ncbi:hypothetical protein L2Y94_15990 [Luteibacter aegosomatis]|uniref:hypothetical protein n=1 Tax=Luteibacter aegosomatis TaxID=2911537 RepID=UPI001FF90C24|nr:hypothetical protein [Luteibacter aegosomatis]UPG84808.1 hypothetical protein L2Y94_15990 [Luteibacter aegosomatis]
MIETIERQRITRVLVLAGIAAVTLFVYAGGLHGPFLIDDVPNLDTISRWIEGRLNWRSAIDNRSGPLGRSVSMLTFLLDAARSGAMQPETFKTTNVIIHIACGILIYTLCRQLFRRFDATRNIASSSAIFVTAWWLFLPLHVSTVLYVVQRMAQLSALFILLALVAYIAIRQWMERRPGFVPHLVLWTAFPAIVALGAFAKENAVLAFPLALLIEAVAFDPRTYHASRPRAVAAFFVLTVGLPCLLVAGWIATHPTTLTAGYQIRPFTLTERLLTEPRVLWSYIKTMILPVGEDMGLFHDNYPISTGWLSPGTTLVAIVAWGAVVGLAFASRRRQPLIFLGIGFFLIGHLLESSAIALEIYFEHRNYLPDLGILIASVGVARALWSKYPAPTPTFRRIVILILPLMLAIYAAATWVQAGNWGDADTLFGLQESYNPTSPRLQAVLAARAVSRQQTDSALAHIDLAERFGPANEGMNSTIWRIIAYCSAGKPVPEPIYEQFEQRTGFPITLNAMRYWEQLAVLAENGCPDAKRMAAAGRRWIGHDANPATSQFKWRSLYNLARMEAAAGNLERAATDVDTAWIDSDHNNGIGVLAFQLNASLGRRKACEDILAVLRKNRDPGNADLTQAVDLFTKALADGTIKAASKSE